MKENVKERIITLLALSHAIPEDHLPGCIRVLCEVGRVQDFYQGLMNDRFPGRELENLNGQELDFLFTFLLTVARKNMQLESERRIAETKGRAWEVIEGGLNK